MQEKLVVLGVIQIGGLKLLDSIQNLLGEMRTGSSEYESLHWHLSGLVDLIEDYMHGVEGQLVCHGGFSLD